MHLPTTNSGTKGHLNISNVGPRFGATKLAAVIIRCALILALLSALLLIATLPAQAQTETVLCNFTGGSDGGELKSSLIFDGAGNLYGTTYEGGLFGYGTVFELSPNGNGGWNERVLYSFTGGADGGYPYSNLIFDSEGDLYGTTIFAGANGYGVVFELSPVGASWTETVLHTFANSPDGANPWSGLIFDPAGNLYGTTWDGGSNGSGTVFELSPSGGSWAEQVIYEQGGNAGLTMNAAGDILGASVYTVFELSPNGNGGWNPTVLHTFCSGKDGCGALGTPVFDQAGNLYGTTEYGGGKNDGTVYKLSPRTKGKKKGEWREKILRSFNGKNGAGPMAGIVFDAAGNIYGTTVAGGWRDYGLVYELVAPVGKGSYKERLFWRFNFTDGLGPLGSLIWDSAGNLYGTTNYGGEAELGVVFELTP